jgi:EpsI family protein
MLADILPAFSLDTAVPDTIGTWQRDKAVVQQVVDPVTAEVLNELYSQILSRTYVSRDGFTVMLSIAYGKNESDDKSLHYPDVCYPAQGFRLSPPTYSHISLPGHELPVKRLHAERAGRQEPITYWIMIGEKVVLNAAEQKVAQLGYGVKGVIPDGMLVRVSSIGGDTARQWAVHAKFVNELNQTVSPQSRKRMFGW